LEINVELDGAAIKPIKNGRKTRTVPDPRAQARSRFGSALVKPG
jgi:hypothetical protein